MARDSELKKRSYSAIRVAPISGPSSFRLASTETSIEYDVVPNAMQRRMGENGQPSRNSYVTEACEY